MSITAAGSSGAGTVSASGSAPPAPCDRTALVGSHDEVADRIAEYVVGGDGGQGAAAAVLELDSEGSPRAGRASGMAPAQGSELGFSSALIR